MVRIGPMTIFTPCFLVSYSSPEPFKAMFNPRYAEVVDLIHSDSAVSPEEPMIVET